MAIGNTRNLSTILELNDLIQNTENYSDIVEKIMDTAANLCDADSYFFYNVNDDKFLTLSYSVSKSLHILRKGSDNLAYAPTIFLPESKRKEQKTIAEDCFFSKEIINLNNIYANDKYDNRFFMEFDEDNDYSTVSILSFPITTRKKDIVGIAQFINPRDESGRTLTFTPETQSYTISVCRLIGILLENKNLSEAYGQLLESFIEVLARAIDAKSPYTGAHCQRVPVIARLLATAAVQTDRGPLKNFEMSADDWYALHIASWLHDCGKVTTPEYIVDKATKLETIYNRIHEIRNRFEILRRDAHIEYLKKRLKNTDTQERLQAEFIHKVKQLEKDYDFIAQCNKNDNPGYETLLQNREDHIFGGYNRGELYNLEVPQGTINKEEREKINEHIVVTIDMLKALPFPKELSKVVEYAGAHHERIDGKGYPNGLTGAQMSIPAKIMAIADIFEALTANDRPYKEPKKLSEVLKIMQGMKNSGHIDPDLYKVFISEQVYLDYAEQYISPEQIDEINPDDYL